MGTSVIDSRYKIDGKLDTTNSVLSNLEILANACGTWITYDIHEGKFAVVINQSGTSIASFSDSNIIGPINIAVTPLDKLYNTVKTSYPHEDLKGQNDWVQTAIPVIDRYANEYDNTLNLDYKVVTNPVQAALLSFIELKQSRVDKVVTFTTDYSQIGIKAGDLVDITSAIHGWTSKMFRVITVSESDQSDDIQIKITALEYDESVYSEDLTRYVRTDSNQIVQLSSLPAPTKPTLTANAVAAKPTASITTTLTSGLVEAVEFWTSTDISLADASRSYSLLIEATPVTIGTNGNVMPLSTNITSTVDSLNAGQVVVKARAKNKDGVSPFSLPSDAFTYAPLQTTMAINGNTAITNNDGSSISGMATAAALLTLINRLRLGDTSAGSLLGSILQPQIVVNKATLSTSAMTSYYNSFCGSSGTFATPYPTSQDITNCAWTSFTTNGTFKQMVLTCLSPLAKFSFKTSIAGSIVTRDNVYAYAPSLYRIYYNDTYVKSMTSDWQTQQVNTTIENAAGGVYKIYICPLVTYDLDQETTYYIFPYNYVINDQGGGAGFTTSFQGYN
jgi:hypothetical protein